MFWKLFYWVEAITLFGASAAVLFGWDAPFWLVAWAAFMGAGTAAQSIARQDK